MRWYNTPLQPLRVKVLKVTFLTVKRSLRRKATALYFMYIANMMQKGLLNSNDKCHYGIDKEHVEEKNTALAVILFRATIPVLACTCKCIYIKYRIIPYCIVSFLSIV